MKIQAKHIGSNVVKIQTDPVDAFVPEEVLRTIARDAINEPPCACATNHERWGCCTDMPMYDEPMMTREPDGIDAHIDRPLRHNFGSFDAWQRALRKYRNAEDAIKACDWECREPMQTQQVERKPVSFVSAAFLIWED